MIETLIVILLSAAIGAGVHSGAKQDGFIGKNAIKNEYVRHQTEMYEFEAHANSIALENEKLKLAKIEQHLSYLESK